MKIPMFVSLGLLEKNFYQEDCTIFETNIFVNNFSTSLKKKEEEEEGWSIYYNSNLCVAVTSKLRI